MEKFEKLRAIAAPIIKNNIDTDVIIPMHRYITADKSVIHKFAFESMRYLPEGEKNPAFSLNKLRFSNAKILIVGQNFGCGSSREAAVWAISGLGIKCIIGQSFGNIFFNNCFENGILVINLSEEAIKEMSNICLNFVGAPEFSVDLLEKKIKAPDKNCWTFDIHEHRRTQLLEGLDGISLTLKHDQDIENFQTLDKSIRPWVYF